MTAMQGALSAAERSMRSVFVGNIPYEATEEQLKDIFAEVGPVVSFRLVYDRETGKPKGYGFCEYKDQEMALSAMRNLNGYELNGRALRVDNAASEKSKEELKNLQASLGGPPVEGLHVSSEKTLKKLSPFGPEINPDKAPDVIAKVMSSLPPEQLYDLMKQMKMSIENNPIETRNLLIQNPQLAYALLQAQVIMRIVEPETAVNMLHSSVSSANQAPVPPSGLLPTPEEEKGILSNQKNAKVNDVPSSFPSVMAGGFTAPLNTSAPMHASSISSAQQPRSSLLGGRPPVSVPNQPNQFHGIIPAAPPGSMNPNPSVLGPRIASAPQARPSLLGDRPVVPNSSKQMPNQFPDRIETRSMGDHDLRVPPMIDRDMRQPPMMIDKDMRQSLGDQDLRTLNAQPVGMPENRQFDPRFRGGPGTDMGSHGSNGPPFDRSRVGPSMDPRAVQGMDPRGGQVMDPRGGQVMDPRGGQIMDRRGGQVMDPRGGQVMDPRGGQVIDPRAGQVMDPRAGLGMDSRGAGMDPRAGPAMEQRSGPNVNSRSQYEGRPLNPPPRMENPHNSTSSNAPPARMHIQNPRVAAVNSGSPHGNSPSNSSPRQQQSGLAAAAASIAPHDQEKANLIMQVLQLSDQQISLLPPEQRQSIMVLKEQIARTQNA